MDPSTIGTQLMFLGVSESITFFFNGKFTTWRIYSFFVGGGVPSVNPSEESMVLSKPILDLALSKHSTEPALAPR